MTSLKLQEEMRKTFRQAPSWQKESREKLDALNREIAAAVVSQALGPLPEKYDELANVLTYLDRVREDIIKNFQRFLPHDKQQLSLPALSDLRKSDEMPWTNRYRVNVLTPREPNGGAPVVYEDYPTYHSRWAVWSTRPSRAPWSPISL